MPSLHSLTPWIGMIAACLTTFSFLPQAIKTLQTRRAEDFSWSYLGMFGVGIILWGVYGILRQDAVIYVANGITTVLVFLIIWTKATPR